MVHINDETNHAVPQQQQQQSTECPLRQTNTYALKKIIPVGQRDQIPQNNKDNTSCDARWLETIDSRI